MPTGNGKNRRLEAQERGKIDQEQVLVILGPTGSGKTGLAIEVAQKLAEQRGEACSAEIISADSRAIYRGMDIGTAKPTPAEQKMVKHWGIDLVEPGERFTVFDFKSYAEQKIVEIQARGRLPIVVGGTGLYIDALIYDYQFSDDVKKTCADRKTICANYLLIGLKWERGELKRRLLERSHKLFAQNIVDETKGLLKKYGSDNVALTADIYPIVRRMMAGDLSEEEAVRLNAIKDWQLAKRQLTWFKRNKDINWLEPENAVDWVLEKYSVK